MFSTSGGGIYVPVSFLNRNICRWKRVLNTQIDKVGRYNKKGELDQHDNNNWRRRTYTPGRRVGRVLPGLLQALAAAEWN